MEGLAGKKMPLSGAGLLAVLLGAAWSIVGHISSGNPSFLVYVLVWSVIYGLFFLWTGRAALAIAFHFAWDLTLSSIFQLGATSETSLFYVRLGEIPDLAFEITSLLGIAAKIIGLLLVLFWIQRGEGRIQVKPGIAIPSLREQ